jgi:hypothetical protein
VMPHKAIDARANMKRRGTNGTGSQRRAHSPRVQARSWKYSRRIRMYT